MGNCCDTKKHDTDNECENIIREAISSLRISNMSCEEFDMLFRKEISISIFDMDDIKWLSKDQYNDLIRNHLISYTDKDKENLNEQILVFLKYEKVSKQFHYNFQLQILSILKDTLLNKIKIIDKLIKKNYQVLSYSSFSKFFNQYVEVNLKVTENFVFSNLIKDILPRSCIEDLRDRIYSKDNIQEFVESHLKSMEGIVLRDNVLLRGKNIGNQFLNNSELVEFFEDHSHLLNMLQLRNTFYKMFCFRSNLSKIKLDD